jgi:hypothetical protein
LGLEQTKLCVLAVQPPQLFGSVRRLTQAPPQQVSPEAQALPQWPQLLVSLPVFVQAVPQQVWPAGQQVCAPVELVQHWPFGQQAPPQQLVPLAQQTTLGELREGQRFCVFPPHSLHAALQLERWALGRLEQ